MTQPAQRQSVLRFDSFEVDLRAGELRRNGRRLKLQEKPLQLLMMLLERPGEVVSKEELQDRLWPDVTVDADAGLGEAVYRLRQTLDDSATAPRYVETIPKRGYRFVAAVGAPEPVAELDPERLAAKTPTKAYAAAIAALAVGATLVGIYFMSGGGGASPRAGPLRKFTVEPAVTAEGFERRVLGGSTIAIAPNGRWIAYPTIEGLWIHNLETEEDQLIVPGRGITSPFWSPDSGFIAFAQLGELKRVASTGGEAGRICQLTNMRFLGGAWSPDGRSIVFSETNSKVLYETPAGGGEPKRVFSDEELEQIGHDIAERLHLEGPPAPLLASPTFLPSAAGERVLLADFGRGGRQSMIAVDLETRRHRILVRGGSPAYSPTGHIVFSASGDLWAVAFSPDELEVTGAPFRIAQDASMPSAARDGTLVYFDLPGLTGRLKWLDRSGEPIGSPVSELHERLIYFPKLSPSGERVAFTARGPRTRELRVFANTDIWVYDLARPLTKKLLTKTPDLEYWPVWSPSEDRIAYSWDKEGENAIYAKQSDGSGEPTLIVGGAGRKTVGDWSQDGRYVLFRSNHPETGFDLWYAELNRDGKTWTQHPFLTTKFTETVGSFSPDGRWVAYQGDSSGGHEVHVRSFPGGEIDRQVSAGGGHFARWSPKGGELFYVDGGTTALYSVPLSTDPELAPGAPRHLFDLPAPGLYDVAPDGQRFLVLEGVSDPTPPAIHVVQNWYEEFRE